jgi:hypothetical protein
MVAGGGTDLVMASNADYRTQGGIEDWSMVTDDKRNRRRNEKDEDREHVRTKEA